MGWKLISPTLISGYLIFSISLRAVLPVQVRQEGEAPGWYCQADRWRCVSAAGDIPGALRSLHRFFLLFFYFARPFEGEFRNDHRNDFINNCCRNNCSGYDRGKGRVNYR